MELLKVGVPMLETKYEIWGRFKDTSPEKWSFCCGTSSMEEALKEKTVYDSMFKEKLYCIDKHVIFRVDSVWTSCEDSK